jgi:hypothetical protein
VNDSEWFIDENIGNLEKDMHRLISTLVSLRDIHDTPSPSRNHLLATGIDRVQQLQQSLADWNLLLVAELAKEGGQAK